MSFKPKKFGTFLTGQLSLSKNIIIVTKFLSGIILYPVSTCRNLFILSQTRYINDFVIYMYVSALTSIEYVKCDRGLKHCVLKGKGKRTFWLFKRRSTVYRRLCSCLTYQTCIDSNPLIVHTLRSWLKDLFRVESYLGEYQLKIAGRLTFEFHSVSTSAQFMTYNIHIHVHLSYRCDEQGLLKT